jgi:glycosyltransferase 2 family protein
MKDKLKYAIKAAIGLAIGLALLLYTIEGKPLSDIAASIAGADILLITFAVGIFLLSMLLRAMRWKHLLKNAGADVPVLHAAMALGMGYLVNSFTPKLGEIARCGSLSRSCGAPFSKSLGTVISERVLDIGMLGAGAGFLLVKEWHRFSELAGIGRPPLDVCIFLLIAMAALGGLLLYWCKKHIRGYAYIKTALDFMRSVIVAAYKSFKLQSLAASTLYTVAIWFLLALLNYVLLQSLPESSGCGFYFSAVLFFISTLGWALPVPSGVGSTHFLVLQIFLAFGLSGDAGVIFGIYSNALAFAMNIILGLIAAAWLAAKKKQQAASMA